MGKNSFEKIDYRLRPAKAVERKMISFTMQKLNSFSLLTQYQYIGFGSTSFLDHIIFHKELGIQKLVSIEKSGKQNRFNFNKPFHCIKIEFGQSVDILPKANWKDKTILWLDYDGILNSNCLSDIRSFFSSAITGSFFILTINANPESYGKDNIEREAKLKELIGEAKLPIPKKSVDYSSVKLPFTIKNILDKEINKALGERNGPVSEKEKMVYKPLFNFHYADGVRMLTIGGIIFTNENSDAYEKANFEELSFIRTDSEPFTIEIPSLTLKEIRFLNSQLPSGITDEGKFSDEIYKDLNPDLPEEDVLNYSKIYNYFPIYAESLVI